MTTTVYIAKFSDSGGREFSGTVSWDKYTPRTLDARLCPYVGPSEVDYAVWSRSAAFGREELLRLVAVMKEKARSMGLTLVAERETEFAVREDGVGRN